MKSLNDMFMKLIVLLGIILVSFSCKSQDKKAELEDEEVAIFGAGCFWCVEAVFSELKGVESVKPGYTGGNTKNPTYKDVCTGTTNHAEVAKIVFDPSIITFDELLEVFWQTHDPTTLNRQGADRGTQYRSVVYYTSEIQKEKVEHYKKVLNESKAWPNPVVTEITELGEFYLAENYHNDYYKNNPGEGYCRMVIQPKVEKFRKAFHDKLK
jgi:peptide-methionine (S)-S-oxide reductase